MTRKCLAIPGVSFLFLTALLPASAQTTPPATPTPPPASAQPATTQQYLSEEELGRLYIVRKQFREAQQVFHRLTVEQPKNAVYWNELGITLHNQGDLSGALKCYEKSAKLDKNYADAVNNSGTVYYERKKYAKAVRYYKKAIATKSDFAPFYLNLGYAYFGEKQYEDSIGSFRKALQIDPDAFEASRSRSGTVVQDRSISADRAKFYFLLAKSFAQSGNVDRCVVYLRKAKDEGYQDMNAVKTDPDFASVLNDPSVQELLVVRPPEPAQP
ncbi:MAG TPA: tetratricopeptide repeat protein [Candidatus Saccharimonadales bacterium]|nr:tetratricopeptide repeat protein [Candidatus Saccharimonadales bacterium]